MNGRWNCVRRMTKARADPAATRRKVEAAGRRTKTAAAQWLQLKGYRIPDRRARMPACEIALVARRGRMLVFVEVKARRRQEMALESMTPQLRKRLTGGCRVPTGCSSIPGVSTS